MIKFLLFLGRIHYVLLFLVLEAVAISFFSSGNAYQRSRIMNTSNIVFGSINSKITGFSDYFGLMGRNEQLMSEVARLRGELSYYSQLAEADSISRQMGR